MEQEYQQMDKKQIELNPVEQQELLEGQQMYEMTKTPGFAVLKRQLEQMAYHSWVDPREIEGDDPQKIWMWRELNAFHASNNASELLGWVAQLISNAEFLDKKKNGEIQVRPMKI